LKACSALKGVLVDIGFIGVLFDTGTTHGDELHIDLVPEALTVLEMQAAQSKILHLGVSWVIQSDSVTGHAK
jgi:hypothetical protein